MNPADKMFTGNVITMEMLAEIMASNQSGMVCLKQQKRSPQC